MTDGKMHLPGPLNETINGKHYCMACGRRFKSERGVFIHLNYCPWLIMGRRHGRVKRLIERRCNDKHDGRL